MSVLTADLVVTHNKLNIKGLSNESMEKSMPNVAPKGAQGGGKDKTKAGNNTSKMNNSSTDMCGDYYFSH
jgi:hypothetical protein